MAPPTDTDGATAPEGLSLSAGSPGGGATSMVSPMVCAWLGSAPCRIATPTPPATRPGPRKDGASRARRWIKML